MKTIYITTKLTEVEINRLFKNFPGLEQPGFPSEVLSIDKETVILLFHLGKNDYIFISDPHEADEWYYIVKCIDKDAV